MGQYHQIVNFDKKERVSPHKIGLGLKQIEHTHTVATLADVLYMLVTTSPNRGGGDLDFDQSLESVFKTWGRWVGDRVAVYGDYTEPEDVPFLNEAQRKEVEQYADITDSIIPAFEKAFYVKIDRPGDGWRNRELSKDWSWLLGDDQELSEPLAPDMVIMRPKT